MKYYLLDNCVLWPDRLAQMVKHSLCKIFASTDPGLIQRTLGLFHVRQIIDINK